MRIHRILQSALVLLAPLACGDTVPGSGAPATVDIRSSDEYVAVPLNSLVPLAPLCAPGVEMCRFGPQAIARVDSAGDVLFVGLTGRRSQVLRMRAGIDTPLVVGRDGSGPGEYRIPAVVGLAPNGDAFVYDLLARRIVRFAPDGRALSTANAPLPMAAGVPALEFVGAELRVLASDVPGSPGDSMPVIAFALDSGAARARRLHALDLHQPSFKIDAMRQMSPLFAPQPRFVIRADGSVAFTEGAKLVVDLFDARGRHERRFGFDAFARPVTPEDIAAERERRVRGIPDARMRSAIEQQLVPDAAMHPAITNLVALNNGEIWVRETPRPAGDSVSWIAFSSAGAPMRRVWTGADDAVLAWSGERLLLHRVSDDDATDGYWWFAVR